MPAARWHSRFARWCSDDVIAVVLLALLLALLLPPVVAAHPQRGYAAYYRPGLMERVSRNRGLPLVGCMIASPYERIGTWLTVRSAKGVRRCRVTDVPQPRDRSAILRRGIVVELDYASNRALCPRNEPPRRCAVEVSR